VAHEAVSTAMQSTLRPISKSFAAETRIRFDANSSSDRFAEPRSFAPRSEPANPMLAGLKDLPRAATLRDVVELVLGERPHGHSQTYANVVLTQRALLRLAEAATGRSFLEWEPEP
jgi:hypothetical protein